MKFYLVVIAICVIVGAADYLYPAWFNDPVRILAMLTWSLAVTLPLTVIFGWLRPLTWTMAQKGYITLTTYFFVYGGAQIIFPQVFFGGMVLPRIGIALFCWFAGLIMIVGPRLLLR